MRIIAAALVVTALAVAGAALAAQDVVVAGQVIFRVSDPGSYRSAVDRVCAVDHAISDAISNEDVGHPNMRVAQSKGLWSVYIGKTFLVSVYPGDARAYGQPAKKVAALWAYRLKQVFPLAEPLTRMKDKSVATRLDRPKPETFAKPVKVPPEHWGVVDLYMLALWKVRQVKPEDRYVEDSRLAAEVVEDAARHYLALASAATGHQPGTCNALRTCADCQAAMAAAVAVPEDMHAAAMSLARGLAADEQAARAVTQVFEYARFLDAKRFMAERVRTSWTLWQRLSARAGALAAAAKAAPVGAESESTPAPVEAQPTPAAPVGQ
jgi:hypothetical protein